MDEIISSVGTVSAVGLVAIVLWLMFGKSAKSSPEEKAGSPPPPQPGVADELTKVKTELGNAECAVRYLESELAKERKEIASLREELQTKRDELKEAKTQSKKPIPA